MLPNITAQGIEGYRKEEKEACYRKAQLEASR